jgi:hypothetical protein
MFTFFCQIKCYPNKKCSEKMRFSPSTTLNLIHNTFLFFYLFEYLIHSSFQGKTISHPDLSIYT